MSFFTPYPSRVRKTSKKVLYASKQIEQQLHYLSFFKSGLRIRVLRSYDTEEFVLSLVRGIEGSKRFQEFKTLRLMSPSDHQIDMIISLLLSEADALHQREKKST